MELLDAYRRSFDDAYKLVIRTLQDLNFEGSGRIKTTISIVEKLKRQSFRLSKLQDVAGCRIIVDDVTEQEHVIELISKAFPHAKVIDRRNNPSHGYRAVHVVVEIDGRFVEIQIRTELQHTWAEWSEALADEYGQTLKYGVGQPDIQKTLTLQSQIFRLLEEQEEIISEALKTINVSEGTRFVSDIASGKPLPAEVFEAMQWYGHLKELIHNKEEEKDRITREILELKQKKSKS